MEELIFPQEYQYLIGTIKKNLLEKQKKEEEKQIVNEKAE
jgi:hypothetical protein